LELKTIRVALATYAICLLPIGVSAQANWDASLIHNPVYQRNCEKCHGKAATGRHFGGPSLTSETVTAASGDDLRNIISNGKGHMPKFAGKLTPEEIDQLVTQVKALSKK
jgi:cytochrome c5